MIHEPVAPRSLEELPEHRREYLLWQSALWLDYEGVEDLVLQVAQRPCPWLWNTTHRQAPLANPRAVLGDDGRYHLLAGDTLLCGEEPRRRRRTPPSGQFTHEQWCYWWTDGTNYRIQAPQTEIDQPPAGVTNRTVKWTFALTDTLTSPELVPASRRCPTSGARTIWPAHHTPTTAMGRLRIKLAAELGNLCHACHLAPAAAVDHDHRTGVVRGLLCRNCNAKIDTCPHVAGCPWADYLNNPPAAHLGLHLPYRRRSANPAHLARVEYLGFSMLD